jgi:hypothetical protein
MTQPLLSACTYTVKSGREADFEKVLAKHWPALHKAGLLTDERPVIYRGKFDERSKPHAGLTFYLEIFTWKDAKDPERAHEMPAVMAVWEPMGALCEHMQFPNVERFEPRA